MFNLIKRLKFNDVYNKISFVNSGFYVFNLAWGILLVVSLFPIDESNLFFHLLIFTLKINILSLVIEIIVAISSEISRLKRDDWNKKYYLEPEVNEPISIFSWREEVAMRIVYSCVCMLLTFGFVVNN